MTPLPPPSAGTAGSAPRPLAAATPPGAAPQEFHYRLRRGAAGHFPGAHRSPRGDSGMEFRAHVPLADAPDPRRLDLQASLRDPQGGWWVRVHAQRMAVPVVMVADLSASMAFQGRHSRRETLAIFTESLAWSAHRHGDAFSFIGADQGLPLAWQQPASRQRGAGLALGRRLRLHGFDGPGSRGADGLLQAHRQLRRERSLVFLVSDFHWPEGLLPRVMASLAGHDVVPVVLWDRSEFELPLQNGLAWLQDSETGQQRLLWVRPALRQRWADRLAAARRALEEQLRPWQVRPLFLLDGPDAQAVTAYFHG